MPIGDGNDAAARRWQWSPPSSISSCSGLVPPPSSLAHSFIHSGELKKELVFRNPAACFGQIRHSSTNERTLPRSPLPCLQEKQETQVAEQTAPFSGLNRRRRVSVRVVLLVRGGGAAPPQSSTSRSRSPFLRSMPTQQVIINKRLTNGRTDGGTEGRRTE